jgi:hypothetical protein
MLYGIPDFYPRFGYATAGPDHFLSLRDLAPGERPPEGWRSRPARVEDLTTLRRLYDGATLRAVGAAVREPDGPVWARLMRAAGTGEAGSEGDSCGVLVDLEDRVRAYAWRAAYHWYVKAVEHQEPEALVIGEAVADGPASADALIAALRIWGWEEAARREGLTHVVVGLPPQGPVAAAAMRSRARLIQAYQPCGGSMARVLDVQRLLRALRPELEARLLASGVTLPAPLLVQTEIGATLLRQGSDGLAVEGADDVEPGEELLTLRVPQSRLARLALGAFPPADLCARLPEPPDGRVVELIEALFPLRHPHMHLPDRF